MQCCGCSTCTIFGTCYAISPVKYICCFTLSLHAVCVQCPIWLFCNAYYSGAMILLPISPFRSSLDNQRNESSWLKCCLFILLTHWRSFLCFLIFSIRTFLILPLCVECLHNICHFSHLIVFNSSATFATVELLNS